MTENEQSRIRTRRPTRHDVAVRAGVSDAVVSYTLNGGAPVARETADRVLDAVRALGYSPNASARALRLGSTKLIGVIVPDTSNPFISELARAVEDAARQDGYFVLTMNSNGESGRTVELVQSLASHQVEGVLVALNVEEGDVGAINALGVRWAVLDPVDAVAGVDGVAVDLVAGARLATHHLITHGCRRIGFVGRVNEARWVGWRAELQLAGMQPGIEVEAEFSARSSGYEAGRQLAVRRIDVDAVFISSDMLAITALTAMHEAGVRIPEDIAVVAFDGSPDSAYTWPTLTTVRQPVRELADQAIQRLLHRGDPLPPPTLLACDLVVRRSCGCNARDAR